MARKAFKAVFVSPDVLFIKETTPEEWDSVPVLWAIMCGLGKALENSFPMEGTTNELTDFIRQVRIK